MVEFYPLENFHFSLMLFRRGLASQAFSGAHVSMIKQENLSTFQGLLYSE